MLIRILADNPGETFTRNLDQKFADTSKELLRSVRDHSVRQMMMETLDSFEKTKSYDEGLALIIDMWKTEKERAQQLHGVCEKPYLCIRWSDANIRTYFLGISTSRSAPLQRASD